MYPQLELLVDLQRLDAELDRLEAERVKIPQEIDALREGVQRVQKEIEDSKAHIANLNLARRKKELEVESQKQAVAKDQARLFEVKNNREYAAMMKEIEGGKAKISGLEDEILELMEGLEEEARKPKEMEEILLREEGRFREEKRKREGDMERLTQRLEAKREKREKLVASLEPKLYQSYMRIRQNRHGLAVVSVVGEICQGCHMSIPPQMVAEVRKSEQLIACGQCNRILYWDDEISPSQPPPPPIPVISDV